MVFQFVSVVTFLRSVTRRNSVPSWPLYSKSTEQSGNIRCSETWVRDGSYGCECCPSEHSASEHSLKILLTQEHATSTRYQQINCAALDYFWTYFCIFLFLHFDFPFSAAIFKVWFCRSELLKKRTTWPVWRRPIFRFNLSFWSWNHHARMVSMEYFIMLNSNFIWIFKILRLQKYCSKSMLLWAPSPDSCLDGGNTLRTVWCKNYCMIG